VKTAGFNPKVDAYIAKSQPFAQPILSHIRELAHKACPEVEEAIKWSMPFFQLRGIVLGHMAAFKQHCSISFWGPEMNAILNKAGLHSEDGMGSLGKITSLKDLPSDKEMLGYYRHAAELILTGQRTKSLERPKKAPRLRRTKRRQKFLQNFPQAANVSTSTGSSRRSGRRRRRSA
jgi:hypothetical protein